MTGLEVKIRDLLPEEIEAAVGVLTRGMRDNPLHVAAYGIDPARRLRCHEVIMRGLFAASPRLRPICAVQDGRVAGIAGSTPPGTCQLQLGRKLRQLPALLKLGPGTTLRVRRWVSAWAARDPQEPHVHLGPVAVDAHLQGHGIGSLLMREHCERLDRAGRVCYLETDKEQNVAFYRRFGFRVVGEEAVLGVPNWFMSRVPG